MINAGYHPGDILVIDRSLEPHDGDVVVAWMAGDDEGFTIKELDLSKQKEGIVRLVPYNDAYSPITITPEKKIIIWGVVTYCIHQSSRNR